MDEFEALVHSLGEHALDYLRRENLKSLAISADAISMSAHIEVCLEDNSHKSQLLAIEKLVELRRMFLDELSIDYVFVDESSCGIPAESREFSYA